MDLKDWDEVAALLGRQPRCSFEVVVRTQNGAPRVIRNDPLLYDGTPMPTLFWLVDPQDCKRISQIESAGGVRQAEQAVDSQALAETHERYARERDAKLPDGYGGPKPSGGVGGCAVGVKCLHAHYAWFLAGGDDPVGRWVDDQIAALATR